MRRELSEVEMGFYLMNFLMIFNDVIVVIDVIVVVLLCSFER